MGGGCCVSNHPILDFLSDLFCSDSCCVGHASGPSESELHAKKVANELAEMKERSNESSSKTEKNIYQNKKMHIALLAILGPCLKSAIFMIICAFSKLNHLCVYS